MYSAPSINTTHERHEQHVLTISTVLALTIECQRVGEGPPRIVIKYPLDGARRDSHVLFRHFQKKPVRQPGGDTSWLGVYGGKSQGDRGGMLKTPALDPPLTLDEPTFVDLSIQRRMLSKRVW